MPWVAELLGTSTSSATIMSALDPVSWDVMPKDLTDGACEAGASHTSKDILLKRCPSRGFNPRNTGMSWMIFKVKVEKSSERDLEAETTSMFFVGSSNS